MPYYKYTSNAICKEVQQAVNINLPQCKSYCCETYDGDLLLRYITMDPREFRYLLTYRA